MTSTAPGFTDAFSQVRLFYKVGCHKLVTIQSVNVGNGQLAQ